MVDAILIVLSLINHLQQILTSDEVWCDICDKNKNFIYCFFNFFLDCFA